MRSTLIMLSLAASLQAVAAPQNFVGVEKHKVPEQAAVKAQLQAKQQNSFDQYQVVTDVVALNKGVPTDAAVVSEFGAHQLVQAKSAVDTTVRQQSVVRNAMTGQLGVVTGRVSVVTNNPSELQSIARTLGLKSLKSLNKGQLVMFQAPADADLVALKAKLAAANGVRAVRLDVVEKRVKAQ